MKIYLLPIITVFMLLLLTSCSDDNFDLYTEEEVHTPVEIDIENGLTYGLSQSSSTINTDGYGITGNGSYHIGSSRVVFECLPSGAFSFSNDNEDGEFFSFFFFADDQDTTVVFGDFETIIDGERTTVLNSLVPQECSSGPLTVDFDISEGRIFGKFTGEFYTFADEIVAPIDSCVNYRSLGILEAAFNVDLVVCD